ncbi:MAG: right-handed parallel beta-helix repeat-containing protein [Verrucomicrobia bacterium]|nr:right-handed parallel beta-helix repeat-containing protein [Verrucomicrobiota bacterium]MBU1857255.1 right-handed parallel beta-helix repeat-containing protein [Verrucomicrobiota bacterium]
MQRLCALIVGLMVAIQMAGAATNYVDRYGTNPTPNYTNWVTAATSIQDAVNVAMATPGNTVLVSNGVYDTGWTKTPGFALTNRVCVTNAIILRSVNGPNYTSIKGAPAPNGLVGLEGMGTGAVRCVYLAGGASLIGFTLTNGYAMTNSAGGSYVEEDMGGVGVFVATSGSVSNCVMVGNYGRCLGGGACLNGGGTLNNCIISNNNLSASYGAGVYLVGSSAKMNNCIVVGNHCELNFGSGVCMEGGSEANNCLIAGNIGVGTYCGGVFAWGSNIKLNSCTIIGNDSGISENSKGGGIAWYQSNASSMTNCIVWGNFGVGSYSNIISANQVSAPTYGYTCSGPVQTGTGNTDSDPQFVGEATGNYRLAENSPCVNAGTYQSWMTGAADLDGHQRLDKFSGIVDIGCYEYVPKGTIVTVP